MDKLTQWVALTVVGVLAVLAVGWFLLVSPKRADAAALRTQAEQQLGANRTLETQLQTLKAQAKDLPQQQAKLAAVAAKIPDVRAMPALIRALTKAAQDAGVELVSVTPGANVPGGGVGAAGAAPVAPVAAPAGTAAGTTTGSAPTVPAVPTAGGALSAVPLALNVVGSYFQVEAFMANLETLPRALRVSNLTLAPGTNPVKPQAGAVQDSGKVLAATITGQVFVSAGLTGAAVPVAGTPVAPPASPAK